jgi:putative addiction module component (TIGR02574 family)
MGSPPARHIKADTAGVRRAPRRRGEGPERRGRCRDLTAILAAMAPGTADLLSTALALPVRERAKIAHELLLSLDDGADSDAAEAWVAELERRAREVRSGSVAIEDWETVRVRLAQRWRRR